MKKSILAVLLFSFLGFGVAKAQEAMHPDKLKEIISQVSDTVQNNANRIQFLYKERLLMCIYDENANRMRIISPIIERDKIEEEELLNAMVANFHSALDVKYALSDEIIWSVFAHPLKELTEGQVLSAIDQVFLANATFGTIYSSTNLVFPGNSKKKEEKPIPERILKKT